jgi:hypothetical protein
MLARVAGLRLEGDAEKARAGLDQTYAELLGSQADLIRRVDSATAAVILGPPERIRVFADLVEEEAMQERDESRAASLRARAEELRRRLGPVDAG